MRDRLRKFLLISGVFVSLALGIIILLFLRVKIEFDNRKVLSDFKSLNIFTKSEMIPFGKYQIHAQYVGNIKGTKVLLIHGSPGYWFDFKKIFQDSTLREHFCLISYDRPGYGNTSLPTQKYLIDQAKIAALVMDHFGKLDEKFIVLGHSYGGAVLEQVMLDFPNRISRGIYVAPCLSPEFQKAKWYNLMVSGGLTNKILPKEFKSSNMEMMTLEECLKMNETKLAEICIPTTYIQGQKDVLVPFRTLNYYLQYNRNIDFKLIKDLNHFVPWSHPELIIQAIKDE